MPLLKVISPPNLLKVILHLLLSPLQVQVLSALRMETSLFRCSIAPTTDMFFDVHNICSVSISTTLQHKQRIQKPLTLLRWNVIPPLGRHVVFAVSLPRCTSLGNRDPTWGSTFGGAPLLLEVNVHSYYGMTAMRKNGLKLPLKEVRQHALYHQFRNPWQSGQHE